MATKFTLPPVLVTTSRNWAGIIAQPAWVFTRVFALRRGRVCISAMSLSVHYHGKTGWRLGLKSETATLKTLQSALNFHYLDKILRRLFFATSCSSQRQMKCVDMVTLIKISSPEIG